MKLVKQIDKTGCGIACVAMLAGITYSTVRRLMFPDPKTREFYTSTNDVRVALKQLGFDVANRLVPIRRNQLPPITENAIIKMNLKPNTGAWHWAVWDAERRRLLDPRRPPYRRRRYVSHLIVKPLPPPQSVAPG